ncbi:MAG TPA: Sec-independent protein translocase protein TatB [Steroidobacteraceae bacterium]|jgi:sec-independent protein translocase protein TatB
MFEVGFTEIVLILGLALLVLGPEKLPGLAQKIGRWTGRARSMARQLRTQLEQEVTIEEITRSRPAQAGSAAAAATATAASAEEPAAAYPPTAESAAPPPAPAQFDLDSMVSSIEAPADAAATVTAPVNEIAAEATRAAHSTVEPGADSKSG